MKYIKAPSPARLLCGSALAYWLSGFVNPAFVAIAVMTLLFIPIFYNDYSHSEAPDKKQPATNRVKPIKPKKSEKSFEANVKASATQLLKNNTENVSSDILPPPEYRPMINILTSKTMS
ncbi:MAG: hypothetical protein WCS87_15240 [Methylococcaceae bacterium]